MLYCSKNVPIVFNNYPYYARIMLVNCHWSILLHVYCGLLKSWHYIIISKTLMKESSSRHTEQNSFPTETGTIPPKNSLALCAALNPLGSDEQDGFFHAPVWGDSFILTYRFCIKSNCVGARSMLRSDSGNCAGKEVVACCELLLAVWGSSASTVRSIVAITPVTPRGRI